MRRNAASIALTFLVVIAITLGLMLSGGPGMGRKERRDETRIADLQALAEQVRCLAKAEDGHLPETIRGTAPCITPRGSSGLRFEDPFTAAPYLYEVVDNSSFTLCAEFEAPERLAPPVTASFNAETGCIRFRNYR